MAPAGHEGNQPDRPADVRRCGERAVHRATAPNEHITPIALRSHYLTLREGSNARAQSAECRKQVNKLQLNVDGGLITKVRPQLVSRDSSTFTLLITLSQSPGVGCRNRRMLGYQGLSIRSSIHRQSGEKGSSTQTGLPMAPAKCATEVSTLMIKSRCAIAAAVSPKVIRSGARSIIPGLA